MPTTDGLDRLQQELPGRVWLPGEDGYDEARLPWNRSVDQRPAAVVAASSAPDVQRAVRAAAGAGLRVTAQANGHGAQGTLEGVVLIRTTALDEISIDVPAATARVGAGVNWGAVLAQLDGTGLVGLAGSNPQISVVGYSLGGGHSFFSRAFGLASESVTAVELVDASGALRRVDDASDSDLMWALRGGGGLFGIVTAMEFRLHPAPQLFGGTVMFPAEQAAATFRTAIDLAAAHPTLGLDVGMTRFPDLDTVPPPMRGRTLATLAIVHLGDAASAGPVVERIRAVGVPTVDGLGEFPISRLAAVANEPVASMPVVDWGHAVSRFDASAADAFVAALGTAMDRGVGHADLRILGGAIGVRSSALMGAFGDDVLGHGSVVLGGPGVDVAAAFEPLDGFIAAHPGRGMLPTFLGAGATLAHAFDATRLARLAQVKQRVDPGGLIVGNRPLG